MLINKAVKCVQKQTVKGLTSAGIWLIELSNQLKYSGKGKLPMIWWDYGQMLLRDSQRSLPVNLLEIKKTATFYITTKY